LKAGRKPEATHSIALAAAIIFLLPFSAQKSHVKPGNHLTPFPTNKICVACQLRPIRYTGYIDQKQASPGHPPGLTRLDGMFWTQLICYEYFADINLQ
jgi:hypothetical protein